MLATYVAVSFFYLGIPVVAHPGRDLIGYGVDPEIFVWSLAWWPHAILHGQNPIVTHAIWAPEGVNLAWTTTAPGLALLAAPVTLLAGPAFSYNLLAVLLPALAAWTAFLLCRHVTRSLWPSLVGGYLFGFSPYIFGQTEGHVHMTAVFLVPLVALVLLRFVEGSLSGWRLVPTLGVLLAFQLSFSTEVAFTLTLAVVGTLALAFAVVPSVRPRLSALLLPLAGAYSVATVLTSPLLAYALLHFRRSSINPPAAYPADLLNVVVPTRLTWLGGHWAASLSEHWLGNDSENGAYLGVPCLAILAWFAWSTRRRPAARFLTIALMLGVLAELGTALHVARHRYVWLPWSPVTRLPLFDNVLPDRLSMFVALGAGVAVASWASSRAIPRLARIGLSTAAVVAVAPTLWLDVWHEHPTRPRFFTAGTYHACLQPDDNVLMLPFPSAGDSMLWQAEAGFTFRMANGYVSPPIPDGVPDPNYAHDLMFDNPWAGWQSVVNWAEAQHATIIVLDATRPKVWLSLLAPVTSPNRIGGVYLYSLRPGGRSACTEGA